MLHQDIPDQRVKSETILAFSPELAGSRIKGTGSAETIYDEDYHDS